MGPAGLPELWRDVTGRTCAGAASQRSQEGNVHARRRRRHDRAAITPLMAKGHAGNHGKPTCTKTEQAASQRHRRMRRQRALAWRAKARCSELGQGNDRVTTHG